MMRDQRFYFFIQAVFDHVQVDTDQVINLDWPVAQLTS